VRQKQALQYAYCGNNPVRYTDPNGMDFKDDAWKQVNRLIADINSRQAKNTQDIAKKKAQIDAGGLSDKKVAGLQKDINKLSTNSSQLEGVRVIEACIRLPKSGAQTILR